MLYYVRCFSEPGLCWLCPLHYLGMGGLGISVAHWLVDLSSDCRQIVWAWWVGDYIVSGLEHLCGCRTSICDGRVGRLDSSLVFELVT